MSDTNHSSILLGFAIASPECLLMLPQLAKQGALNLKTVRHFIIDECDKVLENVGESLGQRTSSHDVNGVNVHYVAQPSGIMLLKWSCLIITFSC